MKMLWDHNIFVYSARVPWPRAEDPQIDWIWSVETLENWLYQHVGSRYQYWAWNQEQEQKWYEACVSFKYEPHKLMFVLTWAK